MLLRPAPDILRCHEELVDLVPGMRREELSALIASAVRMRFVGVGGVGCRV